jgi:sulfite exporter TauE/SafE/plastocyanin
MRPSFSYNLGRVISYTGVGFLIGALGSVFSFSGSVQGALKLAAGIFMIIMGVNMLGLFPWLRGFVPHMPNIFARKIDEQKSRGNSPLIVGLLNGLMPCGPLQSMQLYALSTGSPVAGAVSMFLFSLGTVPLMFSLGALSSVLSRKFTRQVMTAGAALVVILGVSMFSQGWSLAGLSLNGLIPSSVGGAQASVADIEIENGVQMIYSTLQGGRQYPAIVAQAGIPVKWVIDAPPGSINGCNSSMRIPEYGIQHQFKTGENIIEFTPDKPGKFPYSCWMGMIRSTITVVGSSGNSESTGTEDTAAYSDSEPAPAGVTIAVGEIVQAEFVRNEDGEEIQRVQTDISDSGFSPAVIVVQAGVRVEWDINNSSSRSGSDLLLFPAYATQIRLVEETTSLFLFPTDSFDFSTEDHAFYGYVKVVDDLTAVDTAAIAEEVENFQTLIWPDQTFQYGWGENS